MEQLADLVVDAECVSIICVGAPIEDAQKITTNYLSTLWPSKSYKGGMPNSVQIRGYSEQYKTGPRPVGGWHQGPVPKGWVGKLYLKKEADATYTKVWWNAMVEDIVKSKPEPLPTCATTDAGPPDAMPVGDALPVDAAPVGDALPADAAPTETDGTVPDGPGGDTTAPAEDDGCSCRLADPGRGRASGAVLLLLLAFVLFRRRDR